LQEFGLQCDACGFDRINHRLRNRVFLARFEGRTSRQVNFQFQVHFGGDEDFAQGGFLIQPDPATLHENNFLHG
jgi:hypothetical protein